MKIIVAPHVDDEYIGCSSIISEIDKVIYCSEIDEIRKNEAIDLSKKFLFTPIFLDKFDEKELKYQLTRCDMFNNEFYIPTRFDNHPLHKKIHDICLSEIKEASIKFYSIDMNFNPKLLLNKQIEIKKKTLDTYYPSQKHLWNNDNKYFLFENVFEKEYKSFITVRFDLPGFHHYINAPEESDFLKFIHRHLFKFKITIETKENDRELEFFIVKNKIEPIAKFYLKENKLFSCETIACYLINEIKKLYGFDREVEVVVSEDGESDGTIRW